MIEKNELWFLRQIEPNAEKGGLGGERGDQEMEIDGGLD